VYESIPLFGENGDEGSGGDEGGSADGGHGGDEEGGNEGVGTLAVGVAIAVASTASPTAALAVAAAATAAAATVALADATPSTRSEEGLSSSVSPDVDDGVPSSATRGSISAVASAYIASALLAHCSLRSSAFTFDSTAAARSAVPSAASEHSTP